MELRDLTSLNDAIERAKGDRKKLEGRADAELEKIQGKKHTVYRKPSTSNKTGAVELTKLETLLAGMRTKFDKVLDKAQEGWVWN